MMKVPIPPENLTDEGGPVPPEIIEELKQELEKLRELESQLPEEDGIPVENFFHLLQQELWRKSLRHYWRERTDYFAGNNIFVYYSTRQSQNIIQGDFSEFRGPDFFVVLGIDGRKPRRYWVSWQEEGRYPDLVIEIAPKIAHADLDERMKLHERVFRAREYFLVDWEKRTLEGYDWTLKGYEPKVPNERGRLWSGVLELWIGAWEGEYEGYTSRWFRFYTPEGELVLTAEEAERQRAERAEAELQRLRARLAEQGIQLEE